MEDINNRKKYEYLRKILRNYRDALLDVFGEYELCISETGIIFIKSASGKKFIYLEDSIAEDCLCFSNKDDYSYNSFCFSTMKNGISVSETKIDLHEHGYNVENIERLYGKSRYEKDKNALLDLQSTNYVIKGIASFANLMDIDFLESNSVLTTTFSAHMKFFYQVEQEPRNMVSTPYPTHVYFNGEDISYVYEFVDGIDKVSRIYNLYTGNFETITEDIIAIGTGFVDESSFNYRKQNIDEKVQDLIGAVRCIDVQDQIVEEYIEKHLGKLKAVVVELCDLTRTEVGITPMQARERLDAQLEDIIEPKVTSKVKRLIRKFIPLKKKW